MNVKRSYLIPIVILCLMAGQITFSQAEDYVPHLQATTSNTTFAAGTKGNISVSFSNNGNFDVTEVEAILTSSTPGISIVNGAQMIANEIGVGKSISFEPVVMVDQDVVVGAARG